MRLPFHRAWARQPVLVLSITAALLAPACSPSQEEVSGNTTGGTTGSFITGVGGGGSGDTSSGSMSNGSGAGGAGGGTQKLGPPYPIVLAHGFFGFEKFAGLNFETYFYEVKDHLDMEGETMVFTPAVDPFNSSDYRGDQLIEHIQKILAKTGHAKVNIIGHSQGGLDARAVAYKRPDLVASVITVATPHYGSKIGDIVLGLADDPLAQDVINDILKLIGAPLYDQIGNETDVWKSLYLFSEPGIAEFNAKHPDRDGVFYASVTGRTANSPGGDDCTPDVPQDFVSSWNATTDPTDPLLSITETVLGDGFKNIPNDGLVRVKDARWGIFWGCVPADHTDEVGQLLGDSPGFNNKWNHLAFYSELVARVRAQGF